MAFVSVFVIVVFIVDFISGGVVRNSARSFVAVVSTGFSHGAHFISLSGYLRSQSSLAQENATLTSRLKVLEERAALASSALDEISTLKRVVNLAESAKGTAAPIVSSVVASPYGTFLVGAGSSEGIVVGSYVLSPEGFAVARISSVRLHDATALELFVSGSTIPGVVGTSTPLTVRGVGSNNAKASVPHSLSVAVGDVVVSSEVEGRPIGVVGHIDQNPSSADMTVYIGLPVNIAVLEYVYIVAPLSRI